jgi:BRCT domain type II-containing protein
VDFKNLKIGVIRAYHWAAEVEAFASFKHLLESCVTDMDKEQADDENDDDNNDEDGDDDDETVVNEDAGDDDLSAGETCEPDTKKRKIASEYKPDSLKGLKLLFTGTFDSMDRKTCEATAKEHGAKITTKLEDADYIVLGARAGPKKIATIEEKGLRTIDEQGFHDILAGKKPSENTGRGGENSSEPPAKKRKSTTKTQEAKSQTQKTKGQAASSSGPASSESLKGKKILFTGTLETMDRKTAKAVAEKNGAKLIPALDKTDFIVIGINAGPKKLKEIEDKGLKTVTEAEFNAMVGQT